MKPQEMDQEKLLTWIKTYLEKSKVNIEQAREEFYDAVMADDDIKAELLLRDLIVKESVHGMLLEELVEAEEYRRIIQRVQEMSKNAPEA